MYHYPLPGCKRQLPSPQNERSSRPWMHWSPLLQGKQEACTALHNLPIPEESAAAPVVSRLQKGGRRGNICECAGSPRIDRRRQQRTNASGTAAAYGVSGPPSRERTLSRASNSTHASSGDHGHLLREKSDERLGKTGPLPPNSDGRHGVVVVVVEYTEKQKMRAKEAKPAHWRNSVWPG